MTVIAVFVILALLCGFFAWDAHHWRNEYLEAMDGWREALRHNEEAIRMLGEYDDAARTLIDEVDSAVIRVWATNN